MTAAEWDAATNPFPMCAVPAVTESKRRARLFGVACCRRLSRWFPDPRLNEAVTAAEAFADGAVDLKNLEHWSTVATEAHGAAPPRPAEGTGFALEWQAAYAAVNVTHYDDFQNPARQSMIVWRAEQQAGAPVEVVAEWLCRLLRDIYGNPFRPVAFGPEWRTDTVSAVARQMYESRDFSAMPILADALQDAGCDSDDILNHCRADDAVHVRGCWVVDLVLGKA